MEGNGGRNFIQLETLRKSGGKSRRIGSERVSQRYQVVGSGRFGEVDAQAEWLADRRIIEEQSRQARRVERATAAANNRLAIAKYIPRDANARSEVVAVRLLAGVREADAVEGVADKEKPCGRAR